MPSQETPASLGGEAARTVASAAAPNVARGAAKSDWVENSRIIVHPLVTDILLSRDGVLLEKKAQLEVDLFDTNTLNLIASLVPMDAIQAIKWVSSNERVATVDQSGIVTLLKKGNVRITATATDGSRSRANLELTITNKDQ